MIIEIVTYSLLIVISAIADRLRGTGNIFFGRSGEIPGALITGALLMYLFSLPLHSILAFALAWKIGESIGWSEIMGAPSKGHFNMDPDRIEGWQKGILEHNWLLSATVRGALWGLPMALVTYYYAPQYTFGVFLSYTIGFVLAPVISIKVVEKKRWPTAEWIRGGLTMSLMIGLTLLE